MTAESLAFVALIKTGLGLAFDVVLGAISVKDACLTVFRDLMDVLLNLVGPEMLKGELDAAAVRRANALADDVAKSRGLT